MTARLAWLLAAFLVIPAALLPLGTKEMYDEDCESGWDGTTVRSTCVESSWQVAYFVFALDTVRDQRFYDGSWSDWETTNHAYAYTDEDAPNAAGFTPMLVLGGGAMVLSVLVSVAITGIWLLMPRDTLLLAARVAAGLHITALALFLLGMAVHSGTWAGDEFSRLAPSWGIIPAAATFLMHMPLLPERRTAPEGMPALPGM